MKVAVIQGGPSTEAEVSRKSAQGVAAALTQAGHNVQRLELRKELAGELLAGQFDVAFPVLHGLMGEDGAVQGLLEVLGVPYVGSRVLASAVGFDKISSKLAFRACGLPLAAEVVVTRGENLVQAAKRVREQLGKAVVVKPAAQGSSIGVTLIRKDDTDDVVIAALGDAVKLGSDVLCERFVRGREMTCGVIDVPETRGIRPFPVTEVISQAAEWYDWTSRYSMGGSLHECPANISDSLTRRIQDCACKAFRAVGARHLARIDFVVGDGDDTDALTVLEINTLPGMTATSLYPEAAKAAGFSFDRLVDMFVRAAADPSEFSVPPPSRPLPV